MSGTGGRSGTPEGKIARSFPVARLTSQTHSTLKRRATGKDRKNGFSPQGCPPTGINLFAVRQARKGGLRRGVEGGTSGGKTKRSTSPPVADEQPRRKLTRKRRPEEKREAAQVVSLFLCSPQVHFYTLKRSYIPEPKLYW